ncbi:hypothetical protein BKA65DRAFT_223612 [Rhexocercosporidium sp. MPI-PUGE-AT-0058]|nr:hypothetical protein BKA65DRAFT_223612 [Rhexocercosporidium sp. MPI-PUGE-AT-0058]
MESPEPTITDQVVLDTEIEEWIKNPPCAFDSDLQRQGPTLNIQKPSLRIIALEDPRHLEVEQTEGPLLIKKEIYSSIVTNFNLSPLFLSTALNHCAVQFKHHQEPGELNPCLRYIIRTYSTQKSSYCLGLTYRPSDMKTTAFLSGLRNEGIRELFALIKSQKRLIASPMLIPAILSGFNLTYLRNCLFHCHTITNSVKHKLGLAANVMKPTFREPLVNDSLELSQSLTTVFGKLVSEIRSALRKFA